MDITNLIDNLVFFCNEHGVDVTPQEVYSKADSHKWFRGHVQNGKPRNKDASILAFLRDGVPNATIYIHSSGEQLQWKATGFTNLNQRSKVKIDISASIEAQQELAAKAAQTIYNDALKNPVSLTKILPDGEIRELHSYIVKKGLTSEGLVATTGTRLNTIWITVTGDHKPQYNDDSIELIIPLTNANGTIWNLQRIREESFPQTATNKMLLRGSRKTGLFYEVRPPRKTNDAIIIAEGWATAASIAQCMPYRTGTGVYMAIDKGNLLPAAQEIQLAIGIRHPIIFAADNDKTSGNPGVTAAKEAATAIGGTVIIPEEYGDWNDIMLTHGESFVYKAFEKRLTR